MFKNVNSKHLNRLILFYCATAFIIYITIVVLLWLIIDPTDKKVLLYSVLFLCLFLGTSLLFLVRRTKNIIVYFDRNFGKSNMHFDYSEQSQLQGLYVSLKKNLENNMNIVSSSKLRLMELESEKNLLSEALEDIKNSTNRLATKLEQQIIVFQKLSDSLNYRIWKTDVEGNICFMNKTFDSNCQSTNNVRTVFNILNIEEGKFDLFTKRDFGEILLCFKDDASNERLMGRTKRLFFKGSVKKILFLSANSSYDAKMAQNYLKKSRELYIMHEIGRIVSGKSSIESMLQEALRKISYLQNLFLCTVRLVNDASELELIATNGINNHFIIEPKLNRAMTHLHMAYRNNRLLVINHSNEMLFEDEDVLRIVNDGYKVAYIPLSNYNKSFGILSVVSEFEFTSDHLMLLESISINLTIALEKILLYDQLKANYFKTVEAFVTATEIKAERFSGHSRRVAEVCKAIAQKMYLSETEVDEIYIAGLLHDVGKLAFPDNSIDHYVDISKHGVLGRKMIQDVGLNNDILDGIEYHHINYNLSNYNDSSRLEQPFYAQIIKMANDLDLAISNTQSLCSPKQFIEKMAPYSGIFYSPQIFRILESIIDEMKVGEYEKIT